MAVSLLTVAVALLIVSFNCFSRPHQGYPLFKPSERVAFVEDGFRGRVTVAAQCLQAVSILRHLSYRRRGLATILPWRGGLISALPLAQAVGSAGKSSPSALQHPPVSDCDYAVLLWSIAMRDLSAWWSCCGQYSAWLAAPICVGPSVRNLRAHLFNKLVSLACRLFL